MHPMRRSKMIWVMLTFLGAVIATALLLYAIRAQTDYYYSPSDIATGQAPQNKRIRAGGVVVIGSVSRDTSDPLTITFNITDYSKQVSVRYRGILPDLFAENSGIVATGILKGKVFVAQQVLAKHDENYMPPEVADSLKDKAIKKSYD